MNKVKHGFFWLFVGTCMIAIILAIVFDPRPGSDSATKPPNKAYLLPNIVNYPNKTQLYKRLLENTLGRRVKIVSGKIKRVSGSNISKYLADGKIVNLYCVAIIFQDGKKLNLKLSQTI